jgi:drug/metabolite transporter (DMT)-like permease
MVATEPIFIAVLAWAIGMAPKPSGIVWLGLAGGFVGVGILVGPALHSAPNESSHTGAAMLILLCSSFLWSAGSIYSTKGRKNSSPFLAASQQMLCGGALLTLAGLVTGEHHRLGLSRISLLSMSAFAYLVVIGAVVAFTAYIWLLRHCNPAKVATHAYVNPIVAVILGAAFAGETLTARAMLAAGLIIGSVALVITVQQSMSKPTRVDAALARAD